MKASLLENCGQDWFNRRVAGAWFVHNGQVLRIHRAGGRVISCESQGKIVELKAEDIPGFRTFAYPKLGYRRDDMTGAVGFLYRKHTYDRGLRPQCVMVDTSPAYRAMGREFQLHRVSERRLMESVLMPTFDDVEKLHEMLEAKRFAAVLSADVLVEPSVVDGAEDLTVYYRQRPAAHISVAGKIAYRNESYKALLSPMFNKALKV